MKDNLIKFLPSYVGSKAHWVERLSLYQGEDFVEVFAGSAVLSANLAESAILNDLDPIIHKVFTNYSKLIVPEVFTQEDYFKYRKDPKWWKYLYCFQKMSFSGVFRYSKNGYNVPVKKNIQSISVRPDYLKALNRFKKLKPTILNLSFDEMDMNLFVGKVVVFDPPYEGSKAAYNKEFDYDSYWTMVNEVAKVAKSVLIFDSLKNLKKHNLPVVGTRKMRVNGKKAGDIEALAILGENRYINKTE